MIPTSENTIKIECFVGDVSDELMNMLLIADPDKKAVEEYLIGASIFVATESNAIIGVAVLVSNGGYFELKNLVVSKDQQGKGVAKMLIATVKNKAKSNGALHLYVGTGNSSLNQLALYQKCGFRIDQIKRDFFANYPEKIYENGIRCIDMVMLRAQL